MKKEDSQPEMIFNQKLYREIGPVDSKALLKSVFKRSTYDFFNGTRRSKIATHNSESLLKIKALLLAFNCQASQLLLSKPFIRKMVVYIIDKV